MALGALLLSLLATSDCQREQEAWREHGLPAPCVVFAGPPARWPAAAKKAWQLTEDSAACAAGAFRSWPSKRGGPPGDAGVDDDPWLACLVRAPLEVPLWFAASDYTVPTAHRRLEDRWTPAFEALRRSAEPVPTATQLLTASRVPRLPLVRLLVERAADRRQALLLDPEFSRVQRLAVGLEALERRQPAWTCDEEVAVAAQLLADAFAERLPSLMRETWRALSPCAQERLRRQPPPWRVWPRFLLEQVEQGTLATPLALAFLAGGDVKRAREFWAIADAGVPLAKPVEDDAVEAVLSFHLDRTRAMDPFELAVKLSVSNLFPDEALALALPAVAPYEAVLREGVERALFRRSFEGEEPLLAPRLAAAQAAYQPALEAAWRALGAGDGGVPTPVSLPPAPVLFTERDAPWRGPRPNVTTPKRLDLPPGFRPVRVERAGSRTVVLATSQRLDPVGEVSAGAYWLLVSTKAGFEPLYLGLGINRPYEVRGPSKVPLLEEGVVRLEVDDAPLDQRTISFPPLWTAVSHRRGPLVLETTLEALRKDSDGDGLTDVVEARLLLDPQAPDTDGDGTRDGLDSLPRLADVAQPTRAAEVAAALFEAIADNRLKDTGAVLTPPLAPPAPKDQPLPEGARFFIGPEGLLAGFKPRTRIITLTSEEAQAVTERFGVFYPLNVRILVAKDGRRAYVWFNERWRGGAFRCERRDDGTWEMLVLQSWMS